MLSLFSTLLANTVDYGVSFLSASAPASQQPASDSDPTPPTTVQPTTIEPPAKVMAVLETSVSGLKVTLGTDAQGVDSQDINEDSVKVTGSENSGSNKVCNLSSL